MLSEKALILRDLLVRPLQLPDNLTKAKPTNLLEMLTSSRNDYEQNFSDSSSEIADPFLSVHDAGYYREITKKFLVTEDSSYSDGQDASKALLENTSESIKNDIEDFLKTQCIVFKGGDDAIDMMKSVFTAQPTKKRCDEPVVIPREHLWCSSESVKLHKQPVPPGLRILLKQEPSCVDEDEVDTIAWRRHDANVRKCEKWLDENIEKMLEGV